MVPYGETTSQGYHARYWNSNLLENSSKRSNAGISRKNDAVTVVFERQADANLSSEIFDESRGHREDLHTLQARSWELEPDEKEVERKDVTQYVATNEIHNHSFYRTIKVDESA